MLSRNLKNIEQGITLSPRLTNTSVKVWVDEFDFGDSEPEKVNTIKIARLDVGARILSIKIVHEYEGVSIDVGVHADTKAFVDGFDSNQGEVSCNVQKFLGKKLADVDTIGKYQSQVYIIATLTTTSCKTKTKGKMFIVVEHT